MNDDDKTKAKPTRLYTVNRPVEARNIMLATPEVALRWLLQTLSELTGEARAIMIRDGKIPDPDRPSRLILTFDVYGVDADSKGAVNGQDLGI